MICWLPIAEAALEPRENVPATQKCHFEQCTRVIIRREYSVESRLTPKYERVPACRYDDRAWPVYNMVLFYFIIFALPQPERNLLASV